MHSFFQRNAEKNITPTAWFKFKSSAKGLITHCRKNPADVVMVIGVVLCMDMATTLDTIAEEI